MRKFSLFNKRSLTALTLSVAMVLGVTGCGKDGETTANSGKEGNASDVVYVADYLDVKDVGDIVDLKEIDGVLHMLTANYGEESTQYKLVNYNLADASSTETILATANGGYLSSSFFNEDGSLETIESKEEYDDEWNLLSREMYMNKYDATGGLLSSEEASAKLKLDEDFYISYFYKDNEGNYLIGSWEQPLKIYSPDLVQTGEITSNNPFDGLCMTGSGKLVTSYWGNMGVDIAVVDVAAKKVGTPISTNKSSGSTRVWPGPGDTVLYVNGNELCSCDVVTGEIKVVMDVMDMDINADYLQRVYPMGDGSYLMSFYDYGADSDGLFIAKPVDPSTIKERTELTIATVYANQDLNDAVINFNRNNEEYRIKVIDYSTDDWDWEASITNLQNDIVAGNVPDMIDMSSLNIPWRNWAAKGIITDLYPLMEADATFSKEELLENVREAYEVDGSLYVLPSTIGISGVWVKEKFAEGSTALTPAMLLEMEKELPEDVQLFYYSYQGEVMYNMVYNNMTAYVNYETGECNFNSDEFKEVLAYAKEQPVDIVWEEGESLPALLKEDKVIFYTMNMHQMPDYQFHKFVFGEDITVLGYAGEDEDGIRIIPNGCAIAITEQCEHKDIAWQFAKTFVSEEYFTGQHRWGIPVTQAGLDNFIYEAQHMEGTHGYGWDDVNIEIESATDEDVEGFLAILEKADELQYQDTAIMAIIEEEVKPYFEGQKSVDEVADIIQSRVDIYLKENM